MLWCRYLEQLPPTLFVTELLSRSAVQISKHYIVQCRLGFLTDRQLTKLQVPSPPLTPMSIAGLVLCGNATCCFGSPPSWMVDCSHGLAL